MSYFPDYQSDSSDNGLSFICETFQDKALISKKMSTCNSKPIEYRFKKDPISCQFGGDDDDDSDFCPASTRETWPTEINPWWNPSNRDEKPPYTYATMIAHAILSSKTGRLTLNDIYNWIAENYPYYKLGKRGWQNSVRHNLSLKRKWFVKSDRKPSKSHRGRGFYWMLRADMEKVFVDFLSKSGKYGSKMSDIELFTIDSNLNSDSNDDAIRNNEAQNIQSSRYSGFEDKNAKCKTTATAPRIRNMSHDRSSVVRPPKTEPRSFVFRVDQPENITRHSRKKSHASPRPKSKKRCKSTSTHYDDDDGNDSAVEMEYQEFIKRNKMTEAAPISTMHQTDELIMTSTPDLMGDILSFDITQDFALLCSENTYSSPEKNLLYGLQEPDFQSEIRTIDLKTDSIAKQVHCPMTFDSNEFDDPNSYYYGMNDPTWISPDFYQSMMPLASVPSIDFNEVCWSIDDFIQYDEC